MTFLEFFSPSKSKVEGVEGAYLKGLSKGIDIGINIASEIDKKTLEHVKTKAIEDTLRRLNGNNPKNN